MKVSFDSDDNYRLVWEDSRARHPDKIIPWEQLTDEQKARHRKFTNEFWDAMLAGSMDELMKLPSIHLRILRDAGLLIG